VEVELMEVKMVVILELAAVEPVVIEHHFQVEQK
jgi:hypothetical protein